MGRGPRLINHTKFGNNQLRGYNVMQGQIFHCSIGMDCRLKHMTVLQKFIALVVSQYKFLLNLTEVKTDMETEKWTKSQTDTVQYAHTVSNTYLGSTVKHTDNNIYQNITVKMSFIQ